MSSPAASTVGLPAAVNTLFSGVTSTNPARIMGLGDRKGAVAVGLDADLAFVDCAAEWRLDAEHIVSSAGYSIYEGWHFKGRIRHSLVRGAFALREGELVDAARGRGRYLRRKLT